MTTNEDHGQCIVEVELPPVEKCWEIPSDYRDFPLSVEKRGTWADIVAEHSDAVSIRPQELKPLGEYLIALHYAIERNQK